MTSSPAKGGPVFSLDWTAFAFMEAPAPYPFASHFRHRTGSASNCVCHLSAMLKPERRRPPSSTPITPQYLKRQFSFECDAETGMGSINVVTEVAVACADTSRAQETCSPDYDSTTANLRCSGAARHRVACNVYLIENFEDRTPLPPSCALGRQTWDYLWMEGRQDLGKWDRHQIAAGSR